MAVSLKKGQKVSLKKDDKKLDKIMVGLGWDAVKMKPQSVLEIFKALIIGQEQKKDIDCDASAIMLQDGKYNGQNDLVYFGHLSHISGSVEHRGDNLTGDGEGDDEQIIVELSNVPSKYNKIVFVVNIYQAYERKHHFGNISNAYIRIVDLSTNIEMYRYNLSENYDGQTAMIFGEVYRDGDEWKFQAIGEATKDRDLNTLCNHFV